MKDVNTLAGLWYTVSSVGACTVTATKDGQEFVLAELKSAGQRAFQAIGLTVQVSDDAAVVLRADSSAALAAMALDGGGGASIEVDQTYSATSENAQSGKAVASALATIPIRHTYSDLGTTSVTGDDVIAFGKNAVASNYYSVSFGTNANAYDFGTAIGSYSYAKAQNSTGVGYAAKANGSSSTAIGCRTSVTDSNTTAIGYSAKAARFFSTAIGANAEANKDYSVAIGCSVKANDTGCVVIGASPANNIFTQTLLYLISAGSSLANTYEDGVACLGYVVKSKQDGTILECGTRKLSELLTNNTAFAPAALDLDAPAPTPFLPTGIMEPIEFPELNETEQEQ